MANRIPLAKEELYDLRDDIIASIPLRNDDSKTGKLIATLVEWNLDPDPKQKPEMLWKRVWETPYRPPGSTATMATTVLRARKQMANYFDRPGRSKPYRLGIVTEPRGYRLSIEKNETLSSEAPNEIDLGVGTTMGILCREADPFNIQLIAGVQRAANAAGFHLLVRIGNGELNDEARHLEWLKAHSSGIIVVPILDSFAKGASDLTRPFRALERGKFPLVFADHGVPDCASPVVGSDNEMGGKLAAEILAKCSEVWILSEPSSTAGVERAESAKNFVTRARGTNFPVKIRYAEMSGEEGGIEFIDSIRADIRRASQDRRTLGIFATDDRLASGILSYFMFHGSADGKAVRVVGYGGHALGLTYPIRVSIKEDFLEIGKQAVNVLREVIKAKREYGRAIAAKDLSRRVEVGLEIGVPNRPSRPSENPRPRVGQPGAAPVIPPRIDQKNRKT